MEGIDRSRLRKAAAKDPAVREALKVVRQRASCGRRASGGGTSGSQRSSSEQSRLGRGDRKTFDASQTLGTTVDWARSLRHSRIVESNYVPPSSAKPTRSARDEVLDVKKVPRAFAGAPPSNRSKAYIACNSRHERQMSTRKDEFTVKPEPDDPRRQSTYMAQCSTGFGFVPKPEPAPAAYPVVIRDYTARGVSYDTTYDFSDPTQFDKNAFKVGDTFAPSELVAEKGYVQQLRSRLAAQDESIGSAYDKTNILAPWKACTQDKAHWLRGRADGSLSPFNRIEGLK